MQKSVSLLVSSVLMLFATASCATFAEDFDFGTEVVQIEKSLVSYYDTDHNHWYCREALIYVSPAAKKVWFPIQYEGEIVSGTKIEYHCHTVTAYYVNGKRISIDWEGTRHDN